MPSDGHTDGGAVYLNTLSNGGLSTDVVLGRTYEMTYTFETDDSNATVKIFDGITYQYIQSDIEGRIQWTASGGINFAYIRFHLISGGKYAKISNISIKEAKGGNDGTVSGSPETILLPEARNGRDTLGFPINNVNNGYLALHGDGYVTVPQDESTNIAGEMTLEAWFRPRGTGRNIIGSRGSASYWARIWMQDGMDISFETNTSGNYDSLTTAPVTLNDWVHIACTIDSTGEGRIYLDGERSATNSNMAGTLDNDSDIEVGYWSSEDKVNGDIDEPRIYNRSLTEVEVLQNYNASKNKHRND
jgi:hypothetical protein